MNTFSFNLPDALFQTLLGQIAQEVIARLRPPQRVSDWLRSPAARRALRAALLAALADTGERIPLRSIPLFDAAFITRSETIEIAASLLQGESRESVQTRLLAAWQAEFGATPSAQPEAAEAAALLLEALEGRLADYPVFRALLASRAQQENQAAIAALNEALAQAEEQRRNEAQAIAESLARIEAVTALAAPPGPRLPAGAAPTPRRIPPPPDLGLSLGELGLLSQQPLLTHFQGRPLLCAGAGQNRILAWELDQGALGWEYALPAHARPPGSLARWGEYLLVAPQNQTATDPHQSLLLLRLDDGKPAHSLPLPTNRLGAPLVVGDRAYCVGGDGSLFAIDLPRMAVEWRLPGAASLSPFPPAPAGDRLILPGSDPTLTAVDLSGPSIAWRVTAQGQTPHFFASPLVVDDTVYAANWNGDLHALDVASGKERWRWSLPAAENPSRQRVLDRTPVVAGDLLLVASYDHHLYAIARQSGRIRWRSPDLGRRIYSRPAVMGDVVYVAPFRRELYALRLADGEALWPQPLALADRARSDLLALGDLLAAPLRNGELAIFPATQPAQTPECLQATGNWQAAAARLVHLGRHTEAAQLYAAHGLHFLAAQQHEKAGDLAAAAALYSQDPLAPAAWRRAADLERRLGRLAEAAHLLAEKLADWPAAAQAWQEAGEPARAAAIYAEKLGEEEQAVRLYIQAGQPEKAADVYEERGDFNQAIRVLEAADADRFSQRIRQLMRKSIRHSGAREHLQDLLARTPDHRERAAIYADAGEYTQAADEWLAAGEWRKAVDLLVAHDHTERAIALLSGRREAGAQARRAELLAGEKRWQEALDVYAQMGDQAGQAQAQAALGNLEQAAHLWMEAGREQEVARPDEPLRRRLAECYARAARLYEEAFRWAEMEQARRKAHYYGGLPWLVLHCSARQLLLNQRNVLTVTVHNDGGGPAAQVEVLLHDPEGVIHFDTFQPLRGIPMAAFAEQQVRVNPAQGGEFNIFVTVAWRDPSGETRRVALDTPWILQVVDPAASPTGLGSFHAGGDIHYYAGSVGSVVHGGQVNVSRRYSLGREEAENPDAPGWSCPHCAKRNVSAAAFCDGCRERREE